ncbi:hypothetical protein SAMN05444678_108163 [Sphingomonas sp. YR710]|uniref:DUF192 domain-containing protein n=1 Tax=Sphingomonas sp. YR710 TaxID=1882773 RepID=UPI00089076DE|nr:DUF192 domain-containing protein [Sphingomonas sp. YR710]SDD06796.1 hypothetical protein SAMN05444678_108163 [Sphingomonas sp. YR710]
MTASKVRTALVCALIAVAGCAPSSAKPGTSVVAAKLTPLDIVTANRNKTVHFHVEVARTDAEQERGLMFRTGLPDHGGMIFPMASPRWAVFWMKNTLIPLDMIFIRADGHIARIAANTTPQSLDQVSSGEPVIAVLEIIGGGAEKDGLQAGDLVRWPGGPAS